MGPRNEIGLNCSTNGTTKVGNGSVVISDQTGAVLYALPKIWGGDEMYYDAGTAHYVFSGSNNVPPTLAFVNAATSDTEDQTITTAASEHSVAADYVHKSGLLSGVDTAAAAPGGRNGGTQAVLVRRWQ